MIHIPILQYADDTLLCIEGSIRSAQVISCCLDVFAELTGLSLNSRKYALLLFNISAEDSFMVSHVLDMDIHYLPLTYLGLPLGVSQNSIAMWKPVISRIERRLNGWKHGFLSKGGKIDLDEDRAPGDPHILHVDLYAT